jgi:hypothetical protein
MKFLIFPIAIAFVIAAQSSGFAYREMEVVQATCYFFKGEKVAIKNKCRRGGGRWTAGSNMFFTWEDGVVTEVATGAQLPRGKPACPDGRSTRVDNLCGSTYSRHPKTLEKITPKEAIEIELNGKKVVHCVQLQKNSTCWYFGE